LRRSWFCLRLGLKSVSLKGESFMNGVIWIFAVALEIPLAGYD